MTTRNERQVKGMKTEQELKREAGLQPENGEYLQAAELSAEQNIDRKSVV